MSLGPTYRVGGAVTQRRGLATRKLVVAVIAVAAVGLSIASVAWACSGGGLFPNADQTLTPNNHVCPLTSYPNNCPQQTVSVKGTGFINSDNTVPATVDLYWLDEPYFATGTGGPGGPGEQLTANTCRTKGVSLQAGVSVVQSGATKGEFGPVNVTVPPRNATSADGTPRPGAYYGANAVCAVWQHGSHWAGIGNQYTIYPG